MLCLFQGRLTWQEWLVHNCTHVMAQCHIGAPSPSKARTGWNWFSSLLYGTRLHLGQRGAQKELKLICSSLLYGTRLPLGQRGARHRFCSKLMLWTADLLLALVWDKTASGTVRSNTEVLLLAVTEAVLSHTKVRSRSAVQSILSLAPRCPRGNPLQKWGHQFCGALLTQRTLCAGWYMVRSL